MKFLTMQIKYDFDKLSALKQYSAKKEIFIDTELCETLTRLYEKYVPLAVREFIDMNTQESEEVEQKPKKSVRISTSKLNKQETQSQTASLTDEQKENKITE